MMGCFIITVLPFTHMAKLCIMSLGDLAKLDIQTPLIPEPITAFFFVLHEHTPKLRSITSITSLAKVSSKETEHCFRFFTKKKNVICKDPQYW